MTDLLIVAGARPNFMKVASVVEAAGRSDLSSALVHTGQHYDAELSDVFFVELGLPAPDAHLGVGSGSHAEQTARIMTAFEPELRRFDPAVVVVVGDVNSTLACSLVAAKEHYPIAHVEAGLRCHDFHMAEEINRRLCDHLSTFLFTTSRDARENLVLEGIPDERIEFVGNTMIDTLLRSADAARCPRHRESASGSRRTYALLTLHRPGNVDHERILVGPPRGGLEVSRRDASRLASPPADGRARPALRARAAPRDARDPSLPLARLPRFSRPSCRCQRSCSPIPEASRKRRRCSASPA